MNTIEQAFFEAILADIVYVDGFHVPMSAKQLSDLIGDRITEPLAEFISDRFEVLAVESDPSSDYQGVVFRDKTANELYLANRGTESNSITDIFGADFDLAVLSGVAKDQTAAMVNWWLRISQKDTQVAQIESSYLNNFNGLPPVAATGEIADALAAAGGKITVVGHSLGGHLTSVFASLFSGQVKHSSTFNGAGLFSDLADWSPTLYTWAIDYLNGEPLACAAELIGTQVVLPGEAQQNNFYAYNGLNMTTNEWSSQQLGERIALFNEESTALGTDLPNHYLYKLTDSLALMSALAKLDTQLQLDTLNQLFESSSATMLDSNEKLLDAIRRLILGAGVAITPPSDDGGDWEDKKIPDERIQYHQNLRDLQDAQLFKDLLGKVTIKALSGEPLLDATQSGTDAFAYRYALLHLNPFVVTGLDYQKFNGEGELELYNPQTGTGTLTQEWLADRAEMLRWKIELALIDGVTDPQVPLIDGNRPLRMEDRSSDLVIHLGAVGDVTNIIFGSEQSDVIGASAAPTADHRFYCGGGNDSLTGQNGKDYLEGGRDNDTLTGGKGNDSLYGGQGADRYEFSSGDGNDQIIDSDGLGSLWLDGAQLTGGKEILRGAGTWRSDDGKVTYVLLSNPDQSQTLHIQYDNGLIRVNNFVLGQQGHLGIRLADGDAPPVAGQPTLVGDKKPIDMDVTKSGYQYGYDALGNVLTIDVLEVRSDQLYGGSGNDFIKGLGDNDTLQGAAGNDTLEGGLGQDQLDGQEDNDVLVGGEGPDILIGDAGDDRLWIKGTDLFLEKRNSGDRCSFPAN